jgi:GT2 family glycosyltransferase
MTEPSPEVAALSAERERARETGDYALADELRERIAALGYRVVDGADGPRFEPAPAAGGDARRRAVDVESVLEEPTTDEITLQWVVEGWPEDVVRAIAAFRAHASGRSLQLVVADVTDTDPSAYGEDVEVLRLEAQTGWGAARNAGLRRSRGRIVLVLDGSIEPTGDALGPLVRALERPEVGVAGPFGISTPDLREFHESGGVGPDRRVDAIEGYLMAFRRDELAGVGLFDERFRWYRTADIELCFRIRDAGRHAVVVDVPVERHEHRMWAATSAEDRERLSKRNFYRFLERFRGRTDLLVEPPTPG